MPQPDVSFQEICHHCCSESRGNIFKGNSDTQDLKPDWYEATCGKGILDSLQTCILKHKSASNRVFPSFLIKRRLCHVYQLFGLVEVKRLEGGEIKSPKRTLGSQNSRHAEFWSARDSKVPSPHPANFKNDLNVKKQKEHTCKTMTGFWILLISISKRHNYL